MSDLISRDAVAKAVATLSQEFLDGGSPTAVKVLNLAMDRIRAIPAAYHIEKLLEQRDEARRDAVEAETYVGELETKLAKTRTFIYELWDSQGHDASELRDLTDWLDSSPQPNDKLRQMYADYRKAISDGRLKVAPTDAAQARAEALKEAAALFDNWWICAPDGSDLTEDVQVAILALIDRGK